MFSHNHNTAPQPPALHPTKKTKNDAEILVLKGGIFRSAAGGKRKCKERWTPHAPGRASRDNKTCGKEAFQRAVGRPPPRDRGPGLEARLTVMRKALEPPRPRLRKPLRPSASSPSPGKQHRPEGQARGCTGDPGMVTTSLSLKEQQVG